MDSRTSTKTQLLAREGEKRAADYLAGVGYEILAMNFRVGRMEADIVARAPDGKTLVVVEVKTRSSDSAWPEERIDARKQRTLLKIADWIATRNHNRNIVRIDAIAVVIAKPAPPVVTHFEDALRHYTFGR